MQGYTQCLLVVWLPAVVRPLGIMRGAKQAEGGKTYQVAPDWPWTNPTYELTLDTAIKRISSIEIDSSRRMLDTDRSNNSWQPDNK